MGGDLFHPRNFASMAHKQLAASHRGQAWERPPIVIPDQTFIEPMHAALNEISAVLNDAFGSMDSEVAERKTALPLKETSASTANVVNN